MLEVANLSLAYGQHRALDGVALNVGRGEIVTILGANGAGKTSLLKAIAGVVRTLPGKQVSLGGRDISALPAHEIVESRTGAGARRPRHLRRPDGEGKPAARRQPEARPRRRSGAARTGARRCFRACANALAQIARTMSGGEQQMVAIGRALMSNPDILLLDEPSLGLSPAMVQRVVRDLAAGARGRRRAAAGRAERAGEPARSPTAAMCSKTASSSARHAPIS